MVCEGEGECEGSCCVCFFVIIFIGITNAVRWALPLPLPLPFINLRYLELGVLVYIELYLCALKCKKRGWMDG